MKKRHCLNMNLNLKSIRCIAQEFHTHYYCCGRNQHRKRTWNLLDNIVRILYVVRVLRTTAHHQCKHLCILSEELHSDHRTLVGAVLRCLLRCYWMPLQIKIAKLVNIHTQILWIQLT